MPAGARHRKANSTSKPRLSHAEKLRNLSSRGIVVDPTNRRAVARSYQRTARVPTEIERRAPKKIRDEAKAHGFFTTPRGVVVDGPRDKRREPIKGTRIKVLSGGVVQMSTGQRRDYVYGFTKKEKREFAKDPAAFERSVLARLRERFPLLKKTRKPQVRLQWGAYQATKDFAPSYFTARYFATISPEEIRRVGKKKARPRADKLTGFHIVIHVPRKKNGKRKHRRS